MNKAIISIKKIYSELNKTTKHLIITTLIVYFCLIITAIFSHLYNSFELLLLQDDLLETAKSLISTGFFGAVFLEYIYKK